MLALFLVIALVVAAAAAHVATERCHISKMAFPMCGLRARIEIPV